MSSTIDVIEITVRVAYQLFLTFVSGIIVLYPAGSMIVREGWKGQEMFILVHGV